MRNQFHEEQLKTRLEVPMHITANHFLLFDLVLKENVAWTEGGPFLPTGSTIVLTPDVMSATWCTFAIDSAFVRPFRWWYSYRLKVLTLVVTVLSSLIGFKINWYLICTLIRINKS